MSTNPSPSADDTGRPAAAASGTARPVGNAMLRPPGAAAVGFVVVVCVAGGTALGRSAPALAGGWQDVLVWLAITLVAEILWLPTVTGRATSSMAATVNLATLFLLGPAPAIWVVGWGAGLATLFIQRRAPLKALFNLAQAALATAAAGWVLGLVAGGAPLTLEAMRRALVLAPMLAACAAFFAVNTALVSAVVGLWERQPVWRVWRQNYGYAEDLITTLALFLLSPLMVLATLALGLGGLLVCFVPLLMVRNAARRYLELRRATEAMLWNERLAAMGEMAAEVSHELGNLLQVLMSQAQLLVSDAGAGDRRGVRRAARLIYERAAEMRRLSQGLMDFSHRAVRPRPESVRALIRGTVDMLRPQNRFDDVEWRLDLGEDDLVAEVDGGQLRQVLVNLLRNAVEAMAEGAGPRRIEVRAGAHGGRLAIEIRDTGPGFPPALMARAFEPWFTTKPSGHGFGLAVCYRIVRDHGGTIRAGNLPAGGASVRIELPLRAPRSRRLAA